ncbi:MAG: cytochrome P450 [Polyangiaceae bacterium]
MRSPTTELLPGPKGLPVLGSLLDVWDDPLRLFTAATSEFGPNVRLRFLSLDYYLLNDPAAIHHVLVQNSSNYRKSRNYQGLKVMLGEGLLTSEGDFWRKQRRLAQPAFHRDRLAAFAGSMVSCTSDMLDRWDREHHGTPFDLHRELMRLTFRIVGKTLLSTELDGAAKDIGDALNVALDWANDYVESLVRVPPWVPTPKNLRFSKAKEVIETLVDRIVAERRRAKDLGGDLLGMLMAAQDDATGERMSDRQLRHELLTLVLAGHETTANALTFVFYLLSLHPGAMRELAAEVERVLGDRAPTLGDLKQLAYTTMVIEEAMRIYPPAWILEREAIEADVVAGVAVPKDAMIGISPFILHRNHELYPNPEGFDPERFRPESSGARGKHHYLPFGGGPRFCIGNAFAMMELQIVVPMIVQRARLDLVPGFRLELDPSVTLRPRNGVRVTRRRAPGRTRPAAFDR